MALGENGEPEDNNDDSKGGNEDMKHNVFDNNFVVFRRLIIRFLIFRFTRIIRLLVFVFMPIVHSMIRNPARQLKSWFGTGTLFLCPLQRIS